MLQSLNTASSGLQNFQQNIDVIGNNIANVNTTGFKGARTQFEDSFSQALGGPLGSSQVGSGVNISAVTNNFNQGTISRTGVNSDLALSGQGFFVVRNAVDNAQYATRAGDFHVDDNGYLLTNQGYRVQGYNDAGLTTIGDIVIDGTGAVDPTASVVTFQVDQAGNINVRMSDGTTFVRGQVLLQNFRDPLQLVKEGANLYSHLADAGPLAQIAPPQSNGMGYIVSGALELSNVDLTTEFSNLITAQRAFQANARMITTSDEVLQEVVNLKR